MLEVTNESYMHSVPKGKTKEIAADNNQLEAIHNLTWIVDSVDQDYYPFSPCLQSENAGKDKVDLS